MSNWAKELQKWAPSLRTGESFFGLSRLLYSACSSNAMCVAVCFTGNKHRRKELTVETIKPLAFNVLMTSYEYTSFPILAVYAPFFSQIGPVLASTRKMT
jgi:SNF2 family DNA or RNA helicase